MPVIEDPNNEHKIATYILREVLLPIEITRRIC